MPRREQRSPQQLSAAIQVLDRRAAASSERTWTFGKLLDAHEKGSGETIDGRAVMAFTGADVRVYNAYDRLLQLCMAKYGDADRYSALSRAGAEVGLAYNLQQWEVRRLGLASFLNMFESLLRRAPISPNTKAVSLVTESRAILECLADARSATVTQDKLTTGCKTPDGKTLLLSAPTVSKWIHDLEDSGLVRQPRGPKKGWTITDAGLSAIGRAQ